MPTEHDPLLPRETYSEGNEIRSPPRRISNAILTRLRCLFTANLGLIVLLRKVVIVALGYMLFIAFVFRNDGSLRNLHGDPQEPCAHPLHAYAWASLLLSAYTPYHRRLRARFIDGAGTVRRYDQIFQTLALLYVYAGAALVRSCQADAVVETVNAGDVATKMAGTTSDGALIGVDGQDSSNETLVTHTLNACQATCPDLTDAVIVYVTSLVLFTLSIILPLFCLPCIFLWFLRQAMANQGATLAELQEQLRDNNDDDDDDDFMFSFAHGTTVKAEEIMQNLLPVKLVKQPEGNVRIVPMTTTTADILADTTIATATTTWAAKEGSLQCCICMVEFYIYDDVDDDIEAGNMEEQEHRSVVRTPVCGHLFHEQCIASWVGGTSRFTRNDRASAEAGIESDSNMNSTLEEIRQQNRQRRARRTTCPLCRAELQRGVGRASDNTN